MTNLSLASQLSESTCCGIFFCFCLASAVCANQLKYYYTSPPSYPPAPFQRITDYPSVFFAHKCKEYCVSWKCIYLSIHPSMQQKGVECFQCFSSQTCPSAPPGGSWAVPRPDAILYVILPTCSASALGLLPVGSACWNTCRSVSARHRNQLLKPP